MAKRKKESAQDSWTAREVSPSEVHKDRLETSKTIQFNDVRMTLTHPSHRYTYGNSVVFEQYEKDRGWFSVDANDDAIILNFVLPMLVASPSGPRHAAVSFMHSVFFGMKNKFTCKVYAVRRWWRCWKREHVLEFSYADGTDHLGGDRWVNIRSDRDLYEVQKFLLNCLGSERAYELLCLCFEAAGVYNSVGWHND